MLKKAKKSRRSNVALSANQTQERQAQSEGFTGKFGGGGVHTSTHLSMDLQSRFDKNNPDEMVPGQQREEVDEEVFL
uniref:Prp31_C domain-containing protein n=1 Tax=Rhabditophanes sp. KR3021 TaxID=114890 RepID=A0AC35TW58_9BILA